MRIPSLIQEILLFVIIITTIAVCYVNSSSDAMSYDQLAQSQEANTFEVEFEPRAYSKMILHAAKYPHCAVSGLLLASGGRKSTGQIVLTDCIPLFHQSEGELLSFIHFRDYLLPCKRSIFILIVFTY